jgi:hypothetical protein
MSVQHTAVYGANEVASLQDLESSCKRDEADWTAKMIKLERVKNDGKDATAVTYEEVDNIKVGHITLVEYKTEVDKQSLTAIHEAQGETLVLKDGGEAYVNGKAVKVLVFREKP